MIKISFIILFIILIGIILNTNKETNICNKQLTDNEYINHMINHHEVAVYMKSSFCQAFLKSSFCRAFLTPFNI
jgi:hypothetical protein